MAYKPYQQSFFDRMMPLANKASVITGVDPRIIFAQSALESNWGRSAPNNNFFGIKGSGGTQTTREFINGKWVTIKDSFKGYSSMEDSVMGYASFLQNNKRYQPMLGATGLEAQLGALGKSGYATDPGYVGKLKSIIGNIPGGDKLGNVVDTVTDTVEGAKELAGKAVDVGVDAAKIATFVATGNWLAAADTALSMGDDTGENDSILNKFFKFIKNLFSANTAARGAAIIVGFILIAGAIVFLSGVDKTVVNVAKTAVKVAA